MGFKKIKPKVKKARGGDAIIDLGDNWEEWKASINDLDDAEK